MASRADPKSRDGRRSTPGQKQKNQMRTIYDNVGVAKSIVPQSDSGGSPVNGSVVDTLGYNSAMLVLGTGAISGSPTTTSIAVKLQEGSLADGSDMADAKDNTGTNIGGTITAAGSILLARIEGLSTNRKRYLRIVETTTFSGGSTPAVLVHANILLGRGSAKPANTGVSNT